MKVYSDMYYMKCYDDIPCSIFLFTFCLPQVAPTALNRSRRGGRRPSPAARDDGPPPASPLSSRGTPPVPAAGLVSSQRKGNSSGMVDLKPT